MNIIDRIFPRLRFRSSVLRIGWQSGFNGITVMPFARLIFRNIVELLTDILNDVELTNNGSDNMEFAEFKRFVEDEGQSALYRTFRYGYAVVGIFDTGTVRLLRREEYEERTTANVTRMVPKKSDVQVYLLKSDTYREDGISDFTLCHPFLEFLDNTLNASNTMVSNLGALVVASPENINGAPGPVVLDKEDKKEMEDEISKQYGALARQKQIMLLPRAMRFQTISLTNVDNRTMERVKVAVAAICDRIKVPANQVAIIDTASSKTLANGTELKEGDFNKYQSFERLFEHTFMRMADELGLDVDYTIYNKPQREQQPAAVPTQPATE